MNYSISEAGYGRPLRPPATYRRRGVIAITLSGIGAWFASRRRDRKRPRRLYPGEIPGWLREDLGLPPLPPPIRTWWQDL
jgi:hypothetical protein